MNCDDDVGEETVCNDRSVYNGRESMFTIRDHQYVYERVEIYFY